MHRIVRYLAFVMVAGLLLLGALLVQASKRLRHHGADSQPLVWTLPTADHAMPEEWDKGCDLFRSGAYGEAARIFSDAAARYPSEVLFPQAAAESFSAGGQADSALALLQKAETMAPFPDGLRPIRRRILLEGGFALAGGPEASRALELAHTLLSGWPDDSDGLLLQGYAEARLGQAGAAEEVLSQLLAKHPRQIQGYSTLVQLLVQRGDQTKAREWVEKLAAMDPQASGLDVMRQMVESGSVPTQASSERLKVSCPSGCPSGSENKVLEESEQAWTYLRGELGFQPANPVGILVTAAGTTGRPGLPAWASAVFDGQVRVPQDRIDNGLQPILRHELTHAFFAEASGGRVPLWYNEGMAQRMQGETMESLPNASHMEWLDSLPRRQTFTDLDEERARIAYRYSLRLASELWLLHGGGAMRKYLEELKSGTSDSAAFKDAFGSDYASLSARIRAAL